MALEMRPACEKCGAGLGHEAAACICSYECTFCPDCTAGMQHRCPNCGGELVARPRRPADTLSKFPASRERVLKPHGCAQPAA